MGEMILGPVYWLLWVVSFLLVGGASWLKGRAEVASGVFLDVGVVLTGVVAATAPAGIEAVAAGVFITACVVALDTDGKMGVLPLGAYSLAFGFGLGSFF